MDDIQFKRNYSSFISPSYSVTTTQTSTDSSGESAEIQSDFSELLKQQQTLVFSKHAQQRMDSRNIQVTPQLLSQMNSAVETAKEKGITDALIIQDKTAFIVNIPSNTVVTTLSGNEMSSHVFTNINGAVIL